MRALAVLVCLAALACGPVDTSAGTSVGGSPDGGSTGTDGGTGGPVTGGGTPDAGGGGATRQFAVTVVVSGTGRVTSDPAGLDCATTCSGKFDAGTKVTLLPAAGAGWHFDGWGGACTGPGGCAVNDEHTIYATFVQDAPPPPPPPPPASACDGLAPADVPMQQYQRAPFIGRCAAAAGDASGTVAFQSEDVNNPTGDYGTHLAFLRGDGTFLVEQTTWESLRLQPEPAGVCAVAVPGHSPASLPPQLRVFGWKSDGSLAGATGWFRGQGVFAAPDPSGGTVVAGELADESQTSGAYGSSAGTGPLHHTVTAFDAPSTARRFAPQPLASTGAVFGVGADATGRVLVITSGYDRFGAGAISGQWFDRSGGVLTGEFLLLGSFTPGSATWFETAPLIGGGVAVRRMDYDAGFSHARYLVTTVPGGAPQPAPAWLASRTDVQLQIVRGGKAYALAPYGRSGTCTQTVEVVTPDGTSCGTRDYAPAPGSCTTKDLVIGADGTVIQALPSSLETQTPSGAASCTWRWWPAALR